VLVVIGNPTRTSGEFHASHNKRGTKELYYRRHVKPTESRFVDPKWMTSMGRKYGLESPVYKVRVLGEFAEMEENQLIALEWLEQAREKEFVDDGSLSRLRLTVDVMDGGEDESIVTVTRLYDSFTLFVKLFRFSFPAAKSPIETAKAAYRIAEEYGIDWDNGDDIVVDSIGVGSGTAGWLLDNGCNVVVYKGGSKSDDTQKWRCRRVQSYLVLRDAFRDETILYADDFVDDNDWDDYAAQICSVKNKPGIERVEDLETKEEMKRRGLKSPDMADGSAMVYATQTPTLGKGESFEPILMGTMESANYDG
ncbi:MAG: hypothetical protein KAR44_14715, partial [Candidatus Aegiribacteria sp.]|nr:hypothetical protein [Candidatus Aegiribacteria sp.]